MCIGYQNPQELILAMRRWGHSEELIQQTVDDYAEYGFFEDPEATEAYKAQRAKEREDALIASVEAEMTTLADEIAVVQDIKRLSDVDESEEDSTAAQHRELVNA